MVKAGKLQAFQHYLSASLPSHSSKIEHIVGSLRGHRYPIGWKVAFFCVDGIHWNCGTPSAHSEVYPVLGDSLLTTSSTTVAVLRGDSAVGGTVTFEQSSETSPTTITYDIKGSDASAERGMHIHQFGDNTNGCTSAGPHCEFGAIVP